MKFEPNNFHSIAKKAIKMYTILRFEIYRLKIKKNVKNKQKKKAKKNKVKSSIKNILIVDFSRTLGRLTVKIILWFFCISLNRRNHVIRPKSELSRCLYIVLILWFLMSQVKTIKSCYFRTQTFSASKNIYSRLWLLSLSYEIDVSDGGKATHSFADEFMEEWVLDMNLNLH